MNTILEIDTQAFLYLNSLNSPFLDSVMYFISYNTFFMVGILLIALFYIFKLYKKKIFLIFFFLLVAFGLSDSISTRVFKDNIKRLRPCHEPAIAKKVHLAGQNCWGGKFGFVSSHASNSFAVAMFFWLLLGMKYPLSKLLFVHSSFVAYSRIYLGKHYPLDVLCGAMLGCLLAYFSYRLLKKFVLNIN